MGIRVKKVVGYGLTDLTGPEDERLNPDGYLLTKDEIKKEEHWTAEGYLKFLKKYGSGSFDKNPKTPFQDMVVFHLGTHRRGKPQKNFNKLWEPWDSIIYDDEFGLKNVLVVVPFCMAVRGEGGQWKRYDDIVDYCEETHCHGQQRRVVTLADGIHPWNACFEDQYGNRLEMWDVRMHRTDGRFIKSTVPMEVRALCYYLEIFKEPKTVLSMDPLLYVYWA